jgi:2-dehydro-3-deoxyglucarate aldolase
MNKSEKLKLIRASLKSDKVSIGSWMQIPNASIAEIMGDSNFDWVAIDMEHGSFSNELLPDLFRALELGDTLPLVRVAEAKSKDCKQALDAGAAGIILPMIESGKHLSDIVNLCKWPPSGKRGVGFSRANLFGKYFNKYMEYEAQNPLIIPMIENINAVNNLSQILDVEGIDAILIGPYDLSASMGITGDFTNPEFLKVLETIIETAKIKNVPSGIHIVDPDINILTKRIDEGYRFLAFSIDSVLLRDSITNSFLKYNNLWKM